MTEVRDLVIATGKYQNKYGEEKTRWMTIGALFIKVENGETKYSIKLEVCPPLGEDRYIYAFERKKDEGDNRKQSIAPSPTQAQHPQDAMGIDDGKELKIEDVPF